MKKLSSCLAFIMTMVLLSGCEWGSSGSDSSWSDSYSWANFTGVYRPISGNEYLVQKPGTSTSVPSSVTSATQSLGVSDGVSTAHFEGTLSNLPITLGSVTVSAGALSMSDPSGSGTLSGGGGSGTINYTTGVIVIDFFSAPGAGDNVLVSYTYSIPGSDDSVSGPTLGTSTVNIYTMTLTQTGQHLSIIDSSGVSYTGTIINLSQSGGDTSGYTSGTVTANFTANGEDGSEIVGNLMGTYLSPADNSGTSEETVIGGMIGNSKADEDDATITAGALTDRQMQGTYISSDGGTGDIQGVAGTISVTVTE